MHRGDDPAPGEEGAEDAEQVGRHDQPGVPDLQHPLPFLDHHRVEEGGAGEPGHERGVFDRVPAPVAAPAELHVGPAAAEQDAAAEEEPRDERPAPGARDPGGVEPPGPQRRHAVRERDHEAHEAGVEDRRVDRHDRVLEQRVQPVPVAGDEGDRAGGGDLGELPERVAHPVVHVGEEQDHPGEGGDHLGDELVVLPADHARRREDQHQEGPKEQRPVVPGPQRRDLVVPGERRRRVARDVLEAEVVGEEEREERADRERREAEGGDDRPPGARDELRGALLRPDQRGGDGVDAHHHHAHQREVAEVVHLLSPVAGSAASGLPVAVYRPSVACRPAGVAGAGSVFVSS